MSCKHQDFVGVHTTENHRIIYCKRCGQTQNEIDLEQQLAAANARIAAMRNCDNCNKWCMKQPNNSEFDTLNRMDDCKFNNLSHWELSKKIAKAALEEKPQWRSNDK